MIKPVRNGKTIAGVISTVISLMCISILIYRIIAVKTKKVKTLFSLDTRVIIK